MRRLRFVLLLIISSQMLWGCFAGKPANVLAKDHTLDTFSLFDASRSRTIPVAIYQPGVKTRANFIPVIFNHGWGGNMGEDYLKYSYLCNYLAGKGYFVISIQHENKTDEMLAMDGDLIKTRLPNWQRGVENMAFVVSALKERFSLLKYDSLCLIGHSNGGDMAMLFGHRYPHAAAKIISLDNRRMPLPLIGKPKIYSVRSNDQPADEGVLPSKANRAIYSIVVKNSTINHSNMDDDATPAERKWITKKLLKFLEN